MPKEKIFLRSDPHFQMAVGWQRNAEVQVGIEIRDPETSDDPDTILKVVYGGARRKIIGERMKAAIAGIEKQTGVPFDSMDPEWLGSMVLDAVETDYPYTGIWALPDRAGVNALIRALRKARDAAFGKDE